MTGQKFNAQAVKWNWDKVLAVKDVRGIFKKITSFDILDDYTIRANLIFMGRAYSGRLPA